jgi:hypothetical protein
MKPQAPRHLSRPTRPAAIGHPAAPYRVPCRLRWRGMDRYGAASAYGWVGQPALEDRASSRGRVPLASYFVPTMHRATPGTRTLPSFSNALTFAMACARIRSRAGSSTC